ncbi:uncharacterized protein LOC116131417 [Pistacia vera]|uniref:uncharacterized protein LOC116131417 n=1 Tax=Pistacia vera TaxID=55513 RepID=UPI0012632A14|nr:uncharacterized protein LOC116131417 [Pistacia vera]
MAYVYSDNSERNGVGEEEVKEGEEDTGINQEVKDSAPLATLAPIAVDLLRSRLRRMSRLLTLKRLPRLLPSRVPLPRLRFLKQKIVNDEQDINRQRMTNKLYRQKEEMALQSFTDHMMKLWDGWETRVLVLLSLFVQIILIIFGSQRKYTRRIWINLLVWLAYLTADMMATVALGCLARSRRDCAADKVLKLQAFWAPFLLLHLGGPDTITAYSLNDNEFWLRHFLQFVFQVGVAFYVFIPSWRNKDAFIFIAIPVFIAGIIKYGERILVHSSSSKQFKDSLRSPPDISHDPVNLENHKEKEGSEKKSTEEVNNYLVEAVSSFKKFRCLYADLILDHDERKGSCSLFSQKSAKEAFKLIAVELGFMYDVLYTKTTTIYSDSVYAFIVLLFSDWTKLWLTKRNYMSIDTCSFGLLSNDNRRWSGSMGQYNLLSSSLSENKSATSLIVGVQKLFGIKELIEKYKYLTWKEVDDGLLEAIFIQLLEKSQELKGDLFDIKQCKELLGRRGDYVLSKRSFSNEFRWSTIEVEFDYSLLLWHIATDLCYYHDFYNLEEGRELPPECKISKWLSDYLLYLLVIYSTMLPKGIGEMRYKDTCLEVRFLREKKVGSSTEISKVYKALLDESALDQHIQNKGSSLSVLVHGCMLAKQLQGLNILVDDSGRNRKWEVISEVWMEMLGHAANHCGWKEHGEQLMNGGELLTYVFSWHILAKVNNIKSKSNPSTSIGELGFL